LYRGPTYCRRQHDIDDEAAFADYFRQTMPYIEKHGGRYLTKAGTHAFCAT
jgi:uncharacterized protein (DUF1330 family)